MSSQKQTQSPHRRHPISNQLPHDRTRDAGNDMSAGDLARAGVGSVDSAAQSVKVDEEEDWFRDVPVSFKTEEEDNSEQSPSRVPELPVLFSDDSEMLREPQPVLSSKQIAGSEDHFVQNKPEIKESSKQKDVPSVVTDSLIAAFSEILNPPGVDAVQTYNPERIRTIIHGLRDIGIFQHIKCLESNEPFDFHEWDETRHRAAAAIVFGEKYEDIDRNGENLEAADIQRLTKIFKEIFRDVHGHYPTDSSPVGTRNETPDQVLGPDVGIDRQGQEQDDQPRMTAQLMQRVHDRATDLAQGLNRWVEEMTWQGIKRDAVQTKIIAALKDIGVTIEGTDFEDLRRTYDQEHREPGNFGYEHGKSPTKVRVQEELATAQQTQSKVGPSQKGTTDDGGPLQPSRAKEKENVKPTQKNSNFSKAPKKSNSKCDYHNPDKRGIKILECLRGCGRKIHAACLETQKSGGWICHICAKKENPKLKDPIYASRFTGKDDEDDEDGDAGEDADPSLSGRTRRKTKPTRRLSETAAQAANRGSKDTKLASVDAKSAKQGAKRKRPDEPTTTEGEGDGGDNDEEQEAETEARPEKRTKQESAGGPDDGRAPAIVNAHLQPQQGRAETERRPFARGAIKTFGSDGRVQTIRK
ncbi:hypothetical protein, variant [Verruconis gallopava]|uniref:Uncharacterized protein n=1 Tax=Verruconis gallopava TaxID=253628 RepID=A0A0D2B0Q0_9PEZI|nr:hypothetical protein, variant [Verruconis gallopava]KIW04914.1 hypothetical protein, variant [Verruconis gallopava]